MRRGTFRDNTVDYAAVGATSAPDLMTFPPHSALPAEASWRIGSGQERFDAAVETVLSWGVLRGAGLTVSNVRPADAPGYTGVSFDADGKPTAPARAAAEQRFDADGVPYVAGGASLSVHGRVKGFNANGELRVVGFTDQPRKLSVALGTMSGSVVSGEELFEITWNEETDEVRFTVRAFDTAHSAMYKVVPWFTKRRRRALFESYHRALSPAFATP